MANAFNTNAEEITLPYLTIEEYKNAPTAISSSNLIAGGTQAQQDAELANVILRASAWVDRECHQSLVARSVAEQIRVVTRGNGTLTFVPKRFPIIALTALSYGSTPASLIALADVSTAWIVEREVTIPASYPLALSNLSSFPTFGGYWILYTYIHGYVNTKTLAASLAAATSITVKSAAGIQAGQELFIADGADSEFAIVKSNYVFGSAVVTFETALAKAHTLGAAVYAMPSGIKEACILATSAFIKVRGTATKVLSTTSQTSGIVSGSRGINTDLDLAKELLVDYVRKF